jgi:hypothetical protein
MTSGVVFNFFTTAGFVFRQLSIGRFPIFIACYLAIYEINIHLFNMASKFIDSNIVTQAVLLIPLSILSYFLLSILVFKKNSVVSS